MGGTIPGDAGITVDMTITTERRFDRPAPVPESDVALWGALAEADPEALTALFQRHHRAVYNYAFRRTASWSVAEEVTQATFTGLWRRARSGRVDPLHTESALPLLLYLARNESANANRSNTRRLALARRSPHSAGDSDHAELAAAAVDDERQMSDVRRALAKLPRNQQDVIELVAWSHCSTREAAAVLGISEGTVKSRLSRARTKLAGLVDPEGNPLPC